MALPINIEELLNGNTIEWDRIELKNSWNPEEIIHTLCAFANDINNWDGGYIVVGVEEEKGVAKMPPIGLQQNQIDAIQKRLIELSNKIAPHFFPTSQPYVHSDKNIFIIWASAGDYRPYKAPVSLSEKKSEKAYYIRKGSKTVKVQSGSIEERRLLELTSRIPFDDRVNHFAKLNDLNLGLIRTYLQNINSSLFEESINIPFSDLCVQMKIAKGPAEDLRPTNAGILFFNEKPEEFIPSAQIDLIIHKDIIGKEYFEKIFRGDIHKQLKDVLSFIKTHIIREEIIKVENKAEANRFYNYPFQAIEEIVTNAVFHKSYEKNNPIEIQVHPDKIEILSFTGPLPPIDNKTLKKKRIIVRDYRNRKIGDFLKELHLTEGRGTGFPIIYRNLQKNGSPLASFETDEDRTYFLAVINIHPEAKQISPIVKDDSAIKKLDKIVDIKGLNEFLKSISVYDNVRDSVRDSVRDNVRDNVKDNVRDSIQDKVSVIINDVVSDKNKLITTLTYCKTPKSRIETMGKLKLKNYPSNYNRHIKPLINNDWLQMTQPDKRSSKHQKYQTTELGLILLKIL